MNTKKPFDRQKAVIKAAEIISDINAYVQKDNEQNQGAIIEPQTDKVLLNGLFQLLGETQRFESLLKSYEQNHAKK